MGETKNYALFLNEFVNNKCLSIDLIVLRLILHE